MISYRNIDNEIITEKCILEDCIKDDLFGLDQSWVRITDALPITGNVTIGNNGNWFVDGEDTGFKAQGPKGDNGLPLQPRLSEDKTKIEFSYNEIDWHELFPLSLITPTIDFVEPVALEPGATPTVENVGDDFNAILQVGLPKAPEINIGSTTTIGEGNKAKVTNSGTKYAPVLNFEFPKGDTGSGLKILGFYDTFENLNLKVTAPEISDTYCVGTAEPYHLYVWTNIYNPDTQETAPGWKDAGTMNKDTTIIVSDLGGREDVAISQKGTSQIYKNYIFDSKTPRAKHLIENGYFDAILDVHFEFDSYDVTKEYGLYYPVPLDGSYMRLFELSNPITSKLKMSKYMDNGSIRTYYSNDNKSYCIIDRSKITGLVNIDFATGIELNKRLFLSKRINANDLNNDSVTKDKIANNSVSIEKLTKNSIFSSLAIPEWSDTIAELLIFDADIIDNTVSASLLNNVSGNALGWIYCYDKKNVPTIVRIKDIETAINNTLIEILGNHDKLVGYIIFSDIERFMSRQDVSAKNQAVLNVTAFKSPEYNRRCYAEFVQKNSIINNIEQSIDTINDNIEEISDNLSQIVSKNVIEESSTIALQYSPTADVPLYTYSTFSGFGWYLGNVPTFRCIRTKIRCNSYNESITRVTKVLVQFRQDNYDGKLILERLFNIMPIKPTESSEVYLDFEKDITLEGNVWINIRMDTFSTLYKSRSSNYPYDKAGRYFTNGDLTSSHTGATPTFNDTYGNIYMKLYSKIELDTVISDKQMIYISKNIDINEDIDVSLPNKIYAIVGDTLQLFYRGIIKAINPYNYDILVSCSKGKTTPRYFEYTPKEGDVGTTTFKIQVKDNNGKVLAEKSCNLITVKLVKAPLSAIKVLCFGDSLTASGIWCREADRRLTESGGNPTGKELSNIDFCGSKNNEGTGYFGVGGWTWDSYTTKGRPQYRFYVEGVTSLSVGAVYRNNNYNYKIIEVNVTEGNGNILCENTYIETPPQDSGTLTKISGEGDDSISFTSYIRESQNPLWNDEEEKMSFIPYANSVSNGQIDVVYTLLSWNGQSPHRTDFSSVIEQIKIFANTLHEEFPNAKLKIMGVQVPSVNGGMGANYGATGTSYADGYGMVVTALNQNKAYQDFANTKEYSDFVEFVNVSSQFDSEYNMPYAEKSVNVRSNIKENIGTNGVHPSDEGYYQIADVVYRNIIANFCQ